MKTAEFTDVQSLHRKVEESCKISTDDLFQVSFTDFNLQAPHYIDRYSLRFSLHLFSESRRYTDSILVEVVEFGTDFQADLRPLV